MLQRLHHRVCPLRRLDIRVLTLQLKQLDLFLSVEPHLTVSVGRRNCRYSLQELQIFILYILDLGTCVADLTRDKVMTRPNMAVIKRMHLPDFNLLHLQPKVLILFLNLDVTFSLNRGSFGIVKTRLGSILDKTLAKRHRKALLSCILYSLLVVYILHLLAFSVQKTASLQLYWRNL